MSFKDIRLFPVNPLKHTQLAGMMFIQFVVMGCTLPIMSLYMKDYLHFTGLQIGSALSFSVIASFFSPIISSMLADRVIASERLLSIIHLFSAILMFALIQQTRFIPFLIIYVLYTIVLNPAGALTNAICFHHLHDRNIFGDIRLWGTIGWIAAAWIFGALVSSDGHFLLSHNLQGALQLSMIASLVLSVYSFLITPGIKNTVLPLLTNNNSHQNPPLNPLLFFKQLYRKNIFNKKFLLLSFFSCFVTLVDRFYVFGGAPFVKSSGYHENDILSILSIGQIPEIFILLILGLIIVKFGFKATMLAGIGLEIIRFGLFTYGNNDMFLFTGILLHGVTWALFFVPITIYIDQQSTPDTRAAIQQLYSFIYGNGAIAGNLLAGICLDLATAKNGVIEYGKFWFVPMFISILIFIAFAFFFRDKQKQT